jgi:signal transduction histidine kinase
MDAQQQGALAALTQSALAGVDLPTLMQQMVTLVAHRLTVAHSAIWELRPDRSALELRAGIGWPEAAVGRATVEVAATCLTSDAVPGTPPVFVVNWLSEMRLSQPPLLRDHHVISSLCVVILGPSGPFGVLSADSAAPRTFTDEEIHFLQMAAIVLTLAITRAQAYQMVEQRVEERTREIEEQRLAAAQATAVLEERQRLARDLHDSVTQALYGITLHAQVARRLLAAGDLASATTSLGALQNTAQEALDEMRLLIFELRPPILEQVGLVAALRARLNAVEGRANLQTRLIGDGVGDLPSPIEQALYRIAQEALNNALKHADARRITVRLQQSQASVSLEISDDGVGFEPAVACENGGLGLRGIAERVAQLGGTLTLESAAGVGTQLCVEIAL